MYQAITNKVFSTKLAAAIKSATAAQQLFHECGLFAVYQSIEHGNTTPALDLVMGMPKGQRREAMIFWLEHMSWVAFTKGEDGSVSGVKLHKRKHITKEEIESHMAKIESIPYYEYSVEATPEPKPWIFTEKLAQFVKQAKKHLEKQDGVIDPTDLVLLQQTFDAIAAKHAANLAASETVTQ